MLLLFSAAANSTTVIVDFEEVDPASGGGAISVESKGYTFETYGTFTGADIGVSSDGISIFQETLFCGSLCYAGISMERDDGGAFAISSLVAEGTGFFYGTLVGGGSANLASAVGTGDWLSLTVFNYQSNNEFYDDIRLDNIVVSAVPIPAAVWLFGSALAALGWLGKKSGQNNTV